MTTRAFLLPLILIACAFIPHQMVSAQLQDEERIFITSINSEHCPDFEATIRYIDAQGKFIDKLTDRDINISATQTGNTVINATVTKVEVPSIAVAIIADSNAAMRETNAFKRTRFEDMSEQIGDLVNRLRTTNVQYSLVTFTSEVTVAVSRQTDPGYVFNELVTLEPKIPQAANENVPYPLTAAIKAGLEQLQAAPPEYARTLFVYAAGRPESIVDMSVIQPLLENMRSNPPSITFIGLASDLEPGMRSIPGGAYLPYFAQDLPQLDLLRKNLASRYRAVITDSRYYDVHFTATELPFGKNRVIFAIRGSSAQADIDVCSLPPQIVLQPVDPASKGMPQLGITTLFSQTEVISVAYYLDNLPIGVSDRAPDFRFTVDPYEAKYQNHFAAENEYPLFAVATDRNHLQSPRTETILLRIPSRPLPIGLIAIGAGVALLAVASTVWLIRKQPFYKWRNRKQNSGLASSVVRTQELQDTREPAGFSPEGETNPPEAPTNPPETRYHPSKYFLPIRVTVYESHERIVYDLDDPNVPSYGIGRDVENPIRIGSNTGGVSRNHAKLTPTEKGWQITDTSQFGTYVGEHPTEDYRVAPSRPQDVEPGDVIWIGSKIKLIIERV